MVALAITRTGFAATICFFKLIWHQSLASKRMCFDPDGLLSRYFVLIPKETFCFLVARHIYHAILPWTTSWWKWVWVRVIRPLRTASQLPQTLFPFWQDGNDYNEMINYMISVQDIWWFVLLIKLNCTHYITYMLRHCKKLQRRNVGLIGLNSVCVHAALLKLDKYLWHILFGKLNDFLWNYLCVCVCNFT